MFFYTYLLLTVLFAVMLFYICFLRKNRSLLKMKLIRTKREAIAQSRIESTQTLHSIDESDAYKTFYEYAEGKRKGTPTISEWVLLKKEIIQHNETFGKKLEELSLSEIEYQVSMLIKCQFKPKAISKLTCMSKESVTSIRRRLAKKHLNLEKATPQHWDLFVKSL